MTTLVAVPECLGELLMSFATRVTDVTSWAERGLLGLTRVKKDSRTRFPCALIGMEPHQPKP